jgi:hypothetical protein
MPLVRLPERFDHPNWIFEIKYDGFRALAYMERQCARSCRGGTTSLMCAAVADPTICLGYPLRLHRRDLSRRLAPVAW